MKRRAVCLLISILVHALFLIPLLSSKLWMRINLDQLKARYVFIASAEKLHIPEYADNLSRDYPGAELGSEFSNKKTVLQEALEPQVGDISGAEIDRSHGLSPVESGIRDSGVFSSDLSLSFQMELPSKFKSELSPDYKLDLSLNLKETESVVDEKEKDKLKQDLNLWKYIYSDSLNIPPSKASPSYRKFGSRPVRRRRSVSSQREKYDITPWAENVVNKIQRNWIIPSAQKMEAKEVVGIYVTIRKNGELLAVEIVSPSTFLFLDEAALKAVRMSTPFPPLPDDFPKNSIEVYFEFLYND